VDHSLTELDESMQSEELGVLLRMADAMPPSLACKRLRHPDRRPARRDRRRFLRVAMQLVSSVIAT